LHKGIVSLIEQSSLQKNAPSEHDDPRFALSDEDCTNRLQC
jgi:hypothetical protein